MDERHTAAAAALIAGLGVEEAARVAHRVPKTIVQWAEEPEFQAVVLRGIKANALLTLALYSKGQVDAKEGQAALSIMRWLGASKTTVTLKDGKTPKLGEDVNDIPELSEEQLGRVMGD
jgi:hypothetical protein